MLDSSVAAVDLSRNQTGCRVKPGVVFVTREIQLGGHTLFWTLGTFSQLNRKHNEHFSGVTPFIKTEIKTVYLCVCVCMN